MTAEATVRTAQTQIVTRLPNVFWVDMDSLPLDTDKTHFATNGTITGGYLIATNFLNNVGF